MDTQKQLSIIIPTYNRYAPLIRTVDALVRQVLTHELTNSAEVLVVDDGSEPAVVARVRDYIERQQHSFLRYIALPDNRGASTARNTGVQASRGEVLALLDDDIVPADDYVCAMITSHQQHPDALVINGNLRPLRSDVYSGFWFYHYNAVFNKPGEQFYTVKMLASGHCSIKRALLDVMSPLFDTSLAAREDYDLYLRLDTRGIPVYKDNAIVAFIECRRTLYGFLKQRLWYSRGQEQLVAKHGATFLAARQKDYQVPPHRKYWHLYLTLRVARRMLTLHTAARRLFRRSGGSRRT